MANTTFNGPVRSQNGFKTIIKDANSGALTNQMTLETYVATITVANGATTGKETAIGIPDNFIPLAVMVSVTTASSNNVNLQDIGTDSDTDGFVDGISVAVNSTGFKGFFPCNGVLGMSGGTTTASTATAEATELVVSGDPGGDTVIVLKFMGISSSADAS
tara:strand:- start:9358 stop:9840 length:483 start_codon:yes stop_codon:yes gene_type:complete